MLLPSAGIYQAEDIGEISEGLELDCLHYLFLAETRMAEADVDQPFVLRCDQRTEADAFENGGVRAVVLLRI